MSMMRQAAHVSHDIASDSTFAKTFLTLVGGIVGGAGGAYLSGGMGALHAAAKGCSIGGNLGVWIDEAIGEAIVGEVVIGVSSIRVGPDRQAAASNDQSVKQAGCDNQPIGEGSKTVQAEKWSFSRRGDKTLCGHTIVHGCPTVLVGGDPWLGGTPVMGTWERVAMAVEVACQGVGIASDVAHGDVTSAALTAAETVLAVGGQEQLSAATSVVGGVRSGDILGLATDVTHWPE